MAAGQLHIDFEYDERAVRLAAEFALMMVPHMAPGTTTAFVKILSSNLAKLAARRLSDPHEPIEPMRCHTCDEMTTVPDNRVRVAVCLRCASEPRSPGCSA